MIKKLITKEDPYFLHKSMGIFSLLHFFYQFGCFAYYGRMYLHWIYILPHILLHVSSFIFHVLDKRPVSDHNKIVKGDILIKPGKGLLASGLDGEGRVEEPEKILEILKSYIKKRLIFKNKKILITAGPTYEMIDPVRFVGNFSSGKMGFEIAKQAANLGAKVYLISGLSMETVYDENIIE